MHGVMELRNVLCLKSDEGTYWCTYILNTHTSGHKILWIIGMKNIKYWVIEFWKMLCLKSVKSIYSDGHGTAFVCKISIINDHIQDTWNLRMFGA